MLQFRKPGRQIRCADWRQHELLQTCIVLPFIGQVKEVLPMYITLYMSKQRLFRLGKEQGQVMTELPLTGSALSVHMPRYVICVRACRLDTQHGDAKCRC